MFYGFVGFCYVVVYFDLGVWGYIRIGIVVVWLSFGTGSFWGRVVDFGKVVEVVFVISLLGVVVRK